MSYVFLNKKNNAKSTLNGSILAGATALVVTADNFPAASFMATLWDKTTYPDPGDDPNMEVIKVTNKSGTTFTITRAQEGTAGVAHSNGVAIEHLFTAAQIVELETQINTLLAFLATTEIDLGSSGIIYFGDSATNGSWRIRRNGNSLVQERRESGVWNEKTSSDA